MTKKIQLGFLISVIFLFTLFLPFLSKANDVEWKQKNVIVGASQKLEGDLVNFGTTVDISGKVSGDVMIAGGEVDISGEVGGDFLAAGGNIGISGKVAQNFRVAGGNITISGTVGRNLTIAGGSIRVEKSASVSGNAYIGGGSVSVKGEFLHSLTVAGGSVMIAGNVNGDVTVYSNQLVVQDGATIKGKLVYYSDKAASIDKNANIAGGVEQKQLNIPGRENVVRGFNASSLIWFLIWDILSLLAVVFVLWKIFPNSITEITAKIGRNFWKKIGLGLVFLIVTPFAALILLLTVIGIPLGVILSLLYGISLYLGYALSVLMFGKWLVGLIRVNDTPDRFPWYAFLAGVIVTGVVGWVPLFGFLLHFVLLLWGFGALISQMDFKKFKPAEANL